MKFEDSNFISKPNIGSPPTASSKSGVKLTGFAKVVAGGRIVRPDHRISSLQRMVTGEKITVSDPSSLQKAVLDSVSSNLAAGIRLVDLQETALAKLGGKLADISLALSKCKSTRATNRTREDADYDLRQTKSCIRKLAQSTHDNTALFSDGPAKSITVAVPSGNHWEGISIDRANLAQPGLKVVQNSKLHGTSPGFFLDSGTIKRAFNEWRNLCINNRMQWGLLMDRLHGVHRKLAQINKGQPWEIPSFPSGPGNGPLQRPNRNN